MRFGIFILNDLKMTLQINLLVMNEMLSID